jgi:two-component system response regulator FixJ
VDAQEDFVPVISIVDDDPSVRRAIRRLLQSAGYSVEAFATAGDFLASGPPGRSACLVLDIRLGGMTGFDLQEQLAADRSDIPIIFITAHDDVPTRQRVQQAGAAGYLPKPFDGADLLAAVQSAAGPA